MPMTYANANLLQIKYLQIDLDSIRIADYSDAAFANNSDLNSQLERTILSVSKDNIATSYSCESCNSRRVTRSVPKAEVTAIASILDDTFTIRS